VPPTLGTLWDWYRSVLTATRARAKPSNIGAKPENSTESTLPLPTTPQDNLAELVRLRIVWSQWCDRTCIVWFAGIQQWSKDCHVIRHDVLSLEAVKNGKTKVSVFDFCEQLVNVLPNTLRSTEDFRTRENVVIGGSSGNTNKAKGSRC
jgi:hypothetical protein